MLNLEIISFTQEATPEDVKQAKKESLYCQTKYNEH